MFWYLQVEVARCILQQCLLACLYARVYFHSSARMCCDITDTGDNDACSIVNLAPISKGVFSVAYTISDASVFQASVSVSVHHSNLRNSPLHFRVNSRLPVHFDAAGSPSCTVTTRANGSSVAVLNTDGRAVARTKQIHCGARGVMDIEMVFTPGGQAAYASIFVGALSTVTSPSSSLSSNPGHAFSYDCYNGSVCTDDMTGYPVRHGAFTTLLHIRGNMLTFSVDGELQRGSWPIPDDFYVLAVTYFAGSSCVISSI